MGVFEFITPAILAAYCPAVTGDPSNHDRSGSNENSCSVKSWFDRYDRHAAGKILLELSFHLNNCADTAE
jgi:hypothetical protein